MEGSSRWWFVSDLHLDPDVGDARDASGAFAALVAEVVLADASAERDVVLLGDTFELRAGPHRRRHRSAVERLTEARSSFPAFFAGIRQCLDNGVRVHVVCGNHDVWLMTPEVAETMTRLFVDSRPGRRDRLAIHPWVLHVPGLFYAEHGNQHHGLNRMPTLLLGARGGPSAGLPLTPLDAWAGEPGMSTLRRCGLLVGALADAGRQERRSATSEYATMVAQAGLETSLGAEVALAVHAVSRFGVVRTGLGTGRRVIARTLGAGSHDSYLRAAAGRIDRILSAHHRPLCYVFGHTHQARLDPLDRDGAWYANTGTWSSYTHGGGEADPAMFPYVVVTERGPQATVELAHWRMPVRETVRSRRVTSAR
jgi:hypothetical protein